MDRPAPACPVSRLSIIAAVYQTHARDEGHQRLLVAFMAGQGGIPTRSWQGLLQTRLALDGGARVRGEGRLGTAHQATHQRHVLGRIPQ